MNTTNTAREQARHTRHKYTGANALALAHVKDPCLWQQERQHGKAIPSQLIVDCEFSEFWHAFSLNSVTPE